MCAHLLWSLPSMLAHLPFCRGSGAAGLTVLDSKALSSDRAFLVSCSQVVRLNGLIVLDKSS